MTADSQSTPPPAAEELPDPWRKHRILAGILTVFLGFRAANILWEVARSAAFLSGVMSGMGSTGVSMPLPLVAILLAIVIGGLMFCGKQGRGRPMVWFAAVINIPLSLLGSGLEPILIGLAISAYLIWVLRNTKPAEKSLRVAVSRMATPKNLAAILVGLAVVVLTVFGVETMVQYNKKTWEPSERLHGLTIGMSYEDVLRSRSKPDFCRPGVPDFYSGIRQDGEFVCGWVLESGRILRKRSYPTKTLQVKFAECHATEIRADNLGGIYALSLPHDENSLRLPFNRISEMHEILGKEDMLARDGSTTIHTYTDWGVSYVFDEDLLLRAEIGDIEREPESNQEDLSEYATARLKAEGGDAEAQSSIGDFYLGESSRIRSPADLKRQLEQKPDYAEGVKWLQLAAEQGHFVSQLSLARLYAAGARYGLVNPEIVLVDRANTASHWRYLDEVSRGRVPQDFAEAAKWFRLSAEQGDRDSQATIGAMYASGTGVLQDNILAYMWLYLAHEQRYTDRVSHNAVAKHMTADDISKAEAMAREWLEAHIVEGCRSVPAAIG